MVNEFSGLSTGYANYGRQLLSYLHKTDKYEIAELACYCAYGDPRISQFPWKIYPNIPPQHDKNANDQYNSDPVNQFGKFSFESVCVDFKPNHVIDVRDVWMFDYEGISPFRKFFNWLVLAPCDGEHQAADWIYKFTEPDKLFSYCDWNFKQLEKEGNGLLKLEAACPPCVEHEIFKPVLDKKAHKKKYGFKEDTLVVMTINRNQKRKLFPDLFRGFAKFLQDAPVDIANRTLLYVQTCYPDLGFNIPELIIENGLSSKVVMTYVCKNCGLVLPKFYSDVRSFCPGCKQHDMVFPSTQFGLSREILADIMNLADVGVQIASSEGFGIFQAEIASVGVPLISVDYSAMSDVVRKVGGYPIPPKGFQTEAETSVIRAYADPDAFADKLRHILELPENIRAKKGREAHEKAKKYYSWENTLVKWEKAIDDLPIRNNWNDPPRFIQIPQSFPDANQLPDSAFVEWGIANILNRQDLIGSYFAMKMERDLYWTSRPHNLGANSFSDLSLLGLRPGSESFTRQDLFNEFKTMAEKHNFWESIRCQ